MDEKDLELVPVQLFRDNGKYCGPLVLDIRIAVQRGQKMMLPKFVERAIREAEQRPEVS